MMQLIHWKGKGSHSAILKIMLKKLLTYVFIQRKFTLSILIFTEYPLFFFTFSFSNGITPSFLFKLNNLKNFDINNIIQCKSFILNNGSNYSATVTTKAGTIKNPSIYEMQIDCEIEESKGKFLFLAKTQES